MTQELVVRVHAAGDEDFLVARKCDGALAAARQDAAAGDRCFIERSEIRSGGNSVGIVKTRHISAEDEDFSVGQQRGAGRMEIQAALGRDRASGQG